MRQPVARAARSECRFAVQPALSSMGVLLGRSQESVLSYSGKWRFAAPSSKGRYSLCRTCLGIASAWQFYQSSALSELLERCGTFGGKEIRLTVASLLRPLPRLDADNRNFWTGGAAGELRIMRCLDCAAFIHPPRPVCRHCLSDKVKSEAVAGTGIVDTFTVNYQAWYPGLEVPFVIARVALDGVPGVFLTTNIVSCPPGSVEIGDRVRVTFLQQDDVYLPLFEKIG